MELKEIIDFTGIDAKDLTEFKEKFKSKFVSKKEASEDEEVTKAAVSKATGHITGTINTLVKKHFGLTNADLEGKKYEEVIELISSKTNTEITTLKETSSKGNDDKIKDLEAKLEKTGLTLKEEKEAKEALKQALEAKESEWSGKFKSIKVDSILSKTKEAIKPKLIDLSEEQRFYFDSKINESYKFDFDEQEKPIVLGPDGKRIPNANKAGEFLSVEDAILKIAEEKNYVKKNNGTVLPQNVFQSQKQDPVVDTNIKTRTVHPSALKNQEILKAKV